MDTREFIIFVRKKLLEESSKYDEILYSLSYDTMEKGNRIAGRRETLISIADSMQDLLKEFYDRYYRPIVSQPEDEERNV